MPRRVQSASRCALTADPVPDCKPPGVGSIETPPGWHGLRSAAPGRPYIPYYNRAAALSCTASRRGVGIWYRCRAPGCVMRSSVAQAVLYPLVSVWYRERLNGSNSRKSTCKALCAVLCRWRYSCIDDAKRAVNACMGLYCSRAKQKPCTLTRCKAKEKPRQRGRG